MSDRDAVCVIGLGYVGLPLLEALAETGHRVTGLDIDAERIAAPTLGQSYIEDVTVVPLATYTSDPSCLADADVIVIAVPTPLRDGLPDVSAIRAAGVSIAEHMHEGVLVILESTSWPGTTDEVLKPILDAAGVPYHLGFSPERIDPGRGVPLRSIPKIVSGHTPEAGLLVELFYLGFIDQVYLLSGTKEAEFAKLIENAFRQVNIALVNQLSIIARSLGVDVWEALAGAATKPYGYMPFTPGPGVGGHCIAVDSAFLVDWVRRGLGHGPSLLEAAATVNASMAAYVVDRCSDLLNTRSRSLAGSHVLCLGVSYKPGVSDTRESPSLKVMELLRSKGAVVAYHDEFVPAIAHDDASFSSKSVSLTADTIRHCDLVVILTAHPGVNYDLVARVGDLVLDTRGVYRGELPEGVENL